MSRLRHIRRRAAPLRGVHRIRCDCGWSGTEARPGLAPAQIEVSLQLQFRAHLPAHEARTYLLCDARRPADYRSLEQVLADLEGTDPEQARREFEEQPGIVGNFVMPLGEPVLLLSTRERDGVFWGTYQLGDEEPAELPVGEVRTAEGKVFRLDQ